MASYVIGLDLGTSQTKVCVYNKNLNSRRFIKYKDSYFFPTLIVEKEDNTLDYCDETVTGKKHMYFKMSAAEDERLIVATNENMMGQLPNEQTMDMMSKYKVYHELKSDYLVILYIAYILLYVKKNINDNANNNVGGALGRLIGGGNTNAEENDFSVNLGIPTEWHNPEHIKIKIKFQTLLLTAAILSQEFENIQAFRHKTKNNLITKIEKINRQLLGEIENLEQDKKKQKINELLSKFKLSVFPESAAGLNYLLRTQRLANGYYASLDIGAGTSDIAIF
ncbi:hypothetical protein EQP59_05465 [Ornithobacterium rhinotracheale]|nr:hypothetical protein [Ornithobacterium rhinotracheale]QAR30822.1 hypothetical protein EQP59_05465 [Ornithobacterium rhinotracheale]